MRILVHNCLEVWFGFVLVAVFRFCFCLMSSVSFSVVAVSDFPVWVFFCFVLFCFLLFFFLFH